MTYTYEYPRPSLTLDAAVLRSVDVSYPEILLIKRGNEPFRDLWALPGGFLEMEETPLQSAIRELQEETSLKGLPLKPLFSCAQPGRDPRGRTITIVYGCLIKDTATPSGGDDAAEARWFSLKNMPTLAFDHSRVLAQLIDTLVWQAKHSIIGQDYFSGKATKEELIALHSNFVCDYNSSYIDKAVQSGLLLPKDSLFYYLPHDVSGPDWVPMVW